MNSATGSSPGWAAPRLKKRPTSRRQKPWRNRPISAVRTGSGDGGGMGVKYRNPSVVSRENNNFPNAALRCLGLEARQG
jgi:hypothetical protein